MPRNVPGYTILDPTLNDISQIVIRPSINAQGGTDLILSGYYKLKTSDASITEVDQKQEYASFTMSAAQKTAFVSFLTTNLMPVIRTQEGL